jgi:hypothetical protein
MFGGDGLSLGPIDHDMKIKVAAIGIAYDPVLWNATNIRWR